ncbi:MAG: hypothetical protein JST15_08330 [Bacteroidetes bacterium]|nr:hypothetical protein [Bacteroidota bacterium]
MSDNTSNQENITPSEGESRKNIQNSEESSINISENKEMQESAKTVSESGKSEKETEPLIETPKKPLIKLPNSENSNYQISLINQNLLKVYVSTKKGVRINSSVKERKTSSETQNNEIYLFPKFDNSVQEVSVMISIDTDEVKEEEKKYESETDRAINTEIQEKVTDAETPLSEENFPRSNYQINLINENLLKLKIETKKGVRIDSFSRDQLTSSETQSNKIYIHPHSSGDNQIIDIVLEIETAKQEIVARDEEGNIKLIPNPEVVDLIQPPTYPVPLDFEEIPDPVTGFVNPFDALRRLIQRNTSIGIISAVIIHIAAAAFAYYGISKMSKDGHPDELSRLIVIQDLPDPKIKLQDVEDPNKPKEITPPEPEDQAKIDLPKKEVKPRKIIRPPVVNRPKRDNENTKKDSLAEAEINKKLDSLRKFTEGIPKDTISDSTKTDTVKSAYEIPDSLKNDFNEKDIGLAMYFPKNWKLTDQREINKNETEFKGVLLTDTTAAQSGTMTMFVYLDAEKKDYNAEDFKTEFKMNDSLLNAFSKEPKTLAGFTEYRFYIFNKVGTEKLSIRASVRKQFFDQYKNEIEAVVRSISIKKKNDL